MVISFAPPRAPGDRQPGPHQARYLASRPALTAGVELVHGRPRACRCLTAIRQARTCLNDPIPALFVFPNQPMPSAVSIFSRACKPYLSPASAPGACGMVKLWGQDKGAYALAPLLLATVPLATVLLVAGCGTPPARSQSVAQPPAASGSSAPSAAAAASGSPAASGSQTALRVAGRRSDLAGFAADDLGQYRVGTALDAESRRSK